MIESINSSEHWSGYQLIDSGNHRKLERFGDFTLIRPEPQALWQPGLTNKEWLHHAHAEFIQKGSYGGEWKKLKAIKDSWTLNYIEKGLKLKFKLSLTGFKHVGIFPEQADNWQYIYNHMSQIAKKEPDVKFLNLFAYTGGASLAAKAAGADVVHVDSVKQVVSWAKDNMELSGLQNIRWTIEDALKFVQREVKRGKKYHGIALDPPAYGLGTNGERWKLEEQIDELIHATAQLLHPENYVYILNCYSLGFSSLVVDNLLRSHFPKHKNHFSGEIFLKCQTGYKLPLGVVGRLNSNDIHG